MDTTTKNANANTDAKRANTTETDTSVNRERAQQKADEPRAAKIRDAVKPTSQDQKVDEASEESFPASDAPAHGGVTGG